ncbi:MAG: hypothetical protein GC192_11005 [Bacteroidetes bacterium]|nr:hypothetical protein [Bacteroidota bacterium]
MENPNERIQLKVDEIKKKFEERINQIREKGAKRINEINEDAPDPSNVEAALNFTFDVKWRTTSIKFDVPKFTMEREELKFDIPEVRMETEDFSFDVPATRMVTKCVAKKPEFHGLKMYWTCIYLDVPEPYMKRVTIKTDIPKFNSRRMEVKFDKPVVRMETTEIKFNLPQFFLKEVSTQIDEHKREIETVSNEMTGEIASAQQEMKTRLQLEISHEIDDLFENMQVELINQRSTISKNYDDAISKLKTSIKTLKENNAIEQVKSLENQLSNIVDEYKATLASLDKALEDLYSQKEEALKSLKIE